MRFEKVDLVTRMYISPYRYYNQILKLVFSIEYIKLIVGFIILHFDLLEMMLI